MALVIIPSTDPNPNDMAYPKPATRIIAGPDGKLKWNESKRPTRLESIASMIATKMRLPTLTAQKRAPAAGMIIMPTAISVPSA